MTPTATANSSPVLNIISEPRYQGDIPALLKDTDPRLRTRAADYEFTNLPSLWTPAVIAAMLKEALHTYGGLGLAAPQLGLPYRVFVIGDSRDLTQMVVMFNPIVVDYCSSPMILLDEGCLTFPGLFFKITRPERVKVRYTAVGGDTETGEISGITARTFLHEFDHLEGVLFTDRVGTVATHIGMRNRTLRARREKRQKIQIAKYAARTRNMQTAAPISISAAPSIRIDAHRRSA